MIGICIMLFITFLSSVCFSIVLPSIWPFLETMGASQSVVGWAVAVNSGGSFLASPLFGAWSDRRSSREVILVTLIIMVMGNVLYSLSSNIWMLLAGRFIVGVAAANYAVAQTYLSYATTVDNRTKVMAMNSAATVLGFIIGPAFALFTTFGAVNIAGIAINSYTLPGYVSAALSIFAMFSLIWLKEVPESFKKRKKNSPNESIRYGSGFYSGGGSIKDVSLLLKMSKQRKIPVVPVIISLFCYFAYTTSFTVFETIGTPYTKEAFGWTVRMNSIMYIILGGVCVVSLFVLQIFVRFFNVRILLILTTSLSVAGFGILFDPSRTVFVPLWKFWLGVSLCSASYATAVAILISIYSKILENLDQGLMMGWLSSAGSIARIVGPVTASYALQYGGASGYLIFIIMICSMGVTTIIVISSYRLLSPREAPEVKPKIST